MSVNFSPTNWVDNSQPAITASQLNRMEKGIKDCAEAFNQSSAVYKFKGTLEYYQELPNFENEIGDTYHILETGKNYAWNGTEWFEINVSLDIEPFIQDYIVEQGTSDIWTYRKWASGECELYGTNVTTADTTIQEENVWRSEKIGVELPFTVYNHSAFFNTEGHRSWCSGSNFDLDVLTIYYVIYHTIFYESWESKTHILIKGRWK